MKNVIFLIIFIFPLATDAQYTWADRVIGNGIKPDIAYHNRSVFIAYMTEASQGFVKCYEHRVDDHIATTNISTGYFYGPLDIDVDNNGSPRILYHDHTTEDLIHASKQNESWILSQISHPGHDGWDGSIYIDESNRSHLISIDPGGGAEYATLVNTEWAVETINASPTNYKFATDIRVNSDIIHVTYYIANTQELYYSKRENGAWVSEVIAQNAIYPSMTLDDANNPSVAYYKVVGTESSIQLAKREGGQWVSTKIEDISDIEVNFSGARKIVDLEYANGKYHIAFSNKKIVRYGTLEDSGWKLQNAVDVSGAETTLGQQISLVIDENDFPHMTYYERTREVDENGIVHYLRATGRDTTVVPMDTIPSDTISYIYLSSKTVSGETVTDVTYVAKDAQNQIIGEIVAADSIALQDLPEGTAFLCPNKSTNPVENVSALDLVRGQRLILGISEHCKNDFIAADVNKSGEASGLDLIVTINVILGRNSNFPNDESWRFYENAAEIEALSLTDIYKFGCVNVQDLSDNREFQFIGVKLGDINCQK